MSMTDRRLSYGNGTTLVSYLRFTYWSRRIYSAQSAVLSSFSRVTLSVPLHTDRQHCDALEYRCAVKTVLTCNSSTSSTVLPHSEYYIRNGGKWKDKDIVTAAPVTEQSLARTAPLHCVTTPDFTRYVDSPPSLPSS